MRNKFKIIASLLIFTAAFFSSCEKELYEDQIYQSKAQQEITVKKISYKRFKSNRKAVEELKSALTKKNPLALNSRVVYDEEFEMYVDTTNIIVNETPESETITMSVLSEEDLTKVENLVLVLTDDGSYKAFVSEYILTQTQIDILASGGTLDNVTPTSITDLDTSSKMSVSSNCVDISTVTYGTCTDSNGNTIIDYGNNDTNCQGDFNGSVTFNVVNINMSCLADGGGGGSTTSSGDSGSTGTSTGTSGSTGSGPTGGSTSTGSNSTIYDSVIDLLNTTFISPCSDCLELTPELSEFLSELDSLQLNYWNLIGNRDKEVLIKFLNDNNYSDESNDFIKEALYALEEGGQVNIKSEIILDPTFTNNQKVNCVYTKLLSLSNNSYFKETIVELFDSSDKSNVIFAIDNLPTGFDAVTRPQARGGVNAKSLYKITLDQTFVNNATTIEIALTLIHELMHAELLERCLRLGIVTNMGFNSTTFDGVFAFSSTGLQISPMDNLGVTFLNALINEYRNYANPSEWNHNLMTGLNYTNVIAQNLIEAYPLLNDSSFDFINNINNDINNTNGNFTLNDAMYYLSWRGLEGTQNFINLIQNVAPELNKKNYIDAAANNKFTNTCN